MRANSLELPNRFYCADVRMKTGNDFWSMYAYVKQINVWFRTNLLSSAIRVKLFNKSNI